MWFPKDRTDWRANHWPVLMTWGKEQDVTFQELPGIRSCFSEDQGKLGYIPYSSFSTSTHKAWAGHSYSSNVWQRSCSLFLSLQGREQAS